jgi:hypothetical protein
MTFRDKENLEDLSDWIKNSGGDPKVKEVYELLRQYMDSPKRREWQEQRKKNWEAVGENKMWTDQEIKELESTGQLPIVANECNKGVQAATAIATDSKPIINFYPRKSESLYLAELVKRGHDLVWDQNRGRIVLHDAIYECKTSGLVAIDSYFDKNKGIFGKVVFEKLKPTGIYFDDNSEKSDYSDTDIIKAYPRTIRYIKSKYGDKVKDEDLSFGGELLGKTSEEEGKSTGLTAGDSYTLPDAKGSPDEAGSKQPKNIWEIEALLLETRDEFIVTVEFNDYSDPLVFRVEGKTKEAEYEGAEGAGKLLEIFEELHISQEQVEARLERKIDETLLEIIKKVEIYPTKVEIRVQRIIVGKKLIEENINPYGEDPDGDPVLKINILGHSLTDSAYPTCPTTFALPINREKNKRRSQWIYTTSVLNNPPRIEPANKVKWEGKPGTPGAVAKVDTNSPFPPSYMQGGVTNTQDYMAHDIQLSKDIQDQFDTPDVVRGKMPVNKKDASGRAIAYLQDLAGVMSKPFISKEEDWLERWGRANFAVMIKNWKRHQWEALLDEKDWEEWIPEAEKAKLEAPVMPEMPGAMGLEPGNPNMMSAPGQPEAVPQPQKPSGEEIRQRWKDAIDLLCPLEGDSKIDVMDFNIKVAAGSSMPTNRMAKQAEALEQFNAGLLDPETYWEQTDSTLKDKVVPRLKAAAAMGAMMGGKRK